MFIILLVKYGLQKRSNRPSHYAMSFVFDDIMVIVLVWLMVFDLHWVCWRNVHTDTYL